MYELTFHVSSWRRWWCHCKDCMKPLDVFKDTSGHFFKQSLWRRNWIFQMTCWEPSSWVRGDKTLCFLNKMSGRVRGEQNQKPKAKTQTFHFPYQVVSVPKPNQTIITALSQHCIKNWTQRITLLGYRNVVIKDAVSDFIPIIVHVL